MNTEGFPGFKGDSKVAVIGSSKTGRVLKISKSYLCSSVFICG